MNKHHQPLLDKNFFKALLLITLSASIYSVGLHYFVNPANLFPSGFIGVSKVIEIIISRFTGFHFNYMFLYFSLQIVFTILVYKYIGHRFSILTIVQFSIVSLIGIVLPDYPIVSDRILMLIFGGALCGMGIILALKAGASTGGTDFVAIFVQNRDPSAPVWDYIMYFNWMVLLVAGLLSGIETALYSMVYQFVTMNVVSNMDSRHRLSGLYIITDQPDDVSEALFSNLRRGITKLWGEGAYTRQPKTLLFMVVNSFEVNQVIDTILRVDEKAFINVTKSEKVVGNFKRKKIE